MIFMSSNLLVDLCFSARRRKKKEERERRGNEDGK